MSNIVLEDYIVFNEESRIFQKYKAEFLKKNQVENDSILEDDHSTEVSLRYMIKLEERLSNLEKEKEPLNVKIHYHKDKYGDDLLPLEKHGNFFDVRAAKDIDLENGKQALIPLGISLYLPDGYYAELLPRSSSFKHFGFIVANSMGIIDSDYRSLEDEWFLSVIPMKGIMIHKNDRIAQFTIAKEIPFELEEATWEVEARGGHGSSGIK